LGEIKPQQNTSEVGVRAKFKLSKDKVPFLYEPTCEQEVVMAFSIIAKRLGYMIVDSGTSYPDCTAKEIDTGEEIRIEFEYRSSDFNLHGHNPDKCDLVVCWEENVKLGKPEVLALKGFFPPLKSKNHIKKNPKINVHRLIIERAKLPDGLSYPELKELFGWFHPREVREPIRCLARLYKWGAFPYSCDGRLKLMREPQIGEYSLRGHKKLLSLAEQLLQLLKTQWESAVTTE
jgi:hypothetical protein